MKEKDRCMCACVRKTMVVPSLEKRLSSSLTVKLCGFYSTIEGLGLRAALVATSLRTFIEVYDGC